MCGIGGVLRIYEPGEPVPPHHESIPESWLDTLDESIKHRGPDGRGRFRDRAVRNDGTTVDVALVHRRLSIIDHEGGVQPMVHLRHRDGTGELLSPSGTGVPPVSPTPCGTGFQPATPQSPPNRAPRASEGTPNSPHTQTPRLREGLDPQTAPSAPPHTIDATTLPQGTDLVAVAFNGCIYNHRDLRRELEALGHRFETDHADTEVLIHGWRAWGLRMQDELDGMYAALIWDRKAGQLQIARDRAGEKPLYLSHDRLNCIVASTSYAGVVRWTHLHGVIGITIAGRAGALDGWLRTGADPDSPIEVTTEHPQDTLITTDDAPSERGYQRSIPPDRDDSSVHDLGENLHTAVTSRLDADVPLGLFLSGGLDSALIAAIAKQHRPDIKAFTVRMPDPRLDESKAAAETAAHLGLDHTIIDCDPNAGDSPLAEDLVRLIEQLGLPFGDSSLLPTYWVCRAAREHIKVALSGDGGDELFGGYRRHTINPKLTRYRHLLKLIPDRLLDQRSPGSRSTYLARLAVAARHGGYSELLSIFPTPDLRRLIPEIDGEEPGDDWFQTIDDPLRHDFLNYLPDDLLRKTDTASMAVALEVRAPFLARDLVDAALRTPLDVLMPKGQRKGLLKQVARNYLPDHIINRPKQGFAIPIGEWFRSDFGSLRQLLHDHLHSQDPFPGLEGAGVEINMNFVRRMLREHDAAGEQSLNPWHGRDHSQRLYMLLVLSIWSRWLDRTRQSNTDRSPESRASLADGTG